MVYERWIEHILKQLGVGRTYHGYEYVVYGCELVLEDSERLKAVTKLLYLDIAKKYDTTWQCVERDIRTVVDVAWRDEENEFLLEFCGGAKRAKPTAREFLEMVSEYAGKREADDCYCPETGRWCEEKACLQRQIAKLSGIAACGIPSDGL